MLQELQYTCYSNVFVGQCDKTSYIYYQPGCKLVQLAFELSKYCLWASFKQGDTI